MGEASKRTNNGAPEREDNPYLQHLAPRLRGSGKPAPDPLEGLVPRFVTAKQARVILVSANHYA
jgi:hypothetical protein